MNLEYPFYKIYYKFNKKQIINDVKKFEPIIYTNIPNLIKKYNIKKYKNSYFIIKEDYEKSKNINNITDYFSEHIRIKCSFGDYLSPKEYWNKNKNFITRDNSIENIREIIYKNTKLCNNFRITVVLTILNYFKPEKYLDISAGWGDRLLGSILYKIKFYVSCDPNLELHDCYKKIIEKFVPKYKQKNFIIHKTGFIEAPIIQNNFDIVFSSPPFFDLEKYSNFNQDSFTKYKTEKEWCDKFFVPSLIKAYNLLKNNGYMILYMGGSEYILKQMHILDKLMTYCGIIYFYEKIPRAMYVWQKKN
jgi:hypothetical protein